jgi:hypothetical protein
MRPGGLLVHIGLSDGSIFESDLHILLHFGDAVDFDLDEVLNEDALFGALFQLHFLFYIFSQKIMNFLIVNFDKTASNQMRLRCVVLGYGDDLTEGPGNDSSGFLIGVAAHHSMSLSTARLAISEDGSIITVQNAIDE